MCGPMGPGPATHGRRHWETPIIYTTMITDPSRGLSILGVYGRLVYTLCHVHNSRVQQELHTKQHGMGAKRPCGAQP